MKFMQASCPSRARAIAADFWQFSLAVVLAWAQQAPPAQPSANAMPIDVDRGAAGLTRWLHALERAPASSWLPRIPTTKMAACWRYETRGAGARARVCSR